MTSVKTPCVGICSTVFGDEVCRGCKRFVHEVIDWNAYSDEQKRLVKDRLRELGEQVLSGKVVVENRQLFTESLRKASISLDSSEAEQLLELLRKASGQISSPKDHGLQVMPEYRNHSASELKELIDMEIHILSTATYRKNFKRGLSRQSGQKESISVNSSGLRNPEISQENEVKLP